MDEKEVINWYEDAEKGLDFPGKFYKSVNVNFWMLLDIGIVPHFVPNTIQCLYVLSSMLTQLPFDFSSWVHIIKPKLFRFW